MAAARSIVLLMFLAVLAAPLALRRDAPLADRSARQLIILTPHHEKIRAEFGPAFESWHERQYGEPVRVVWVIPGGTSEIRQMLQAQFQSAAQDGRPVGGSADLVFGGGQFEHDELKRGVPVGDRSVPISQPPRFEAEEVKAALGVDSIEEAYGGRDIAGSPLFDADGYWFGTALSGFGIVFNRDLLNRLNVADPGRWRDLCNSAFVGWIALANPAQSGSIRKSFDTVLQTNGWIDGWRVLRRVAANARHFAASSSRVPVEVGQGDAAAGVCIDFYGRIQAQAIAEQSGSDRLGFIDPPGEGAIDADPVSMLAGAPSPDLARRFILFCLTDEAQTLWQLPRRESESDTLGPMRFELRRLPILRSAYQRFGDRFIDQVNPYELARTPERSNGDYAAFVGVMVNAMAIDNHAELRSAWRAITSHPAYPQDAVLPDLTMVTDPHLRRMLELFDELPTVPGPNGAAFTLSDDASIAAVRRGWLARDWKDSGLWPRGVNPEDVLRAQFGRFFRERYEQIAAIASDRGRSSRGGS